MWTFFDLAQTPTASSNCSSYKLLPIPANEPRICLYQLSNHHQQQTALTPKPQNPEKENVSVQKFT
jgi:hypothetical protein